jgi:hypothetical protein
MFLPISFPLSRWRQDDQPRRAPYLLETGQCLIAKQKVDAKRAGNSRVYEVNVERTTIARDGTLSLVLR